MDIREQKKFDGIINLPVGRKQLVFKKVAAIENGEEVQCDPLTITGFTRTNQIEVEEQILLFSEDETNVLATINPKKTEYAGERDGQALYCITTPRSVYLLSVPIERTPPATPETWRTRMIRKFRGLLGN